MYLLVFDSEVVRLEGVRTRKQFWIELERSCVPREVNKLAHINLWGLKLINIFGLMLLL
jgi:hypothetical protein